MHLSLFVPNAGCLGRLPQSVEGSALKQSWRESSQSMGWQYQALACYVEENWAAVAGWANAHEKTHPRRAETWSWSCEGARELLVRLG